MKQVVYVDVLFALNMIISFVMIKAVCRLGRESPSTMRVLLGSLLGGMYSLSIFLPELSAPLLVFVRLIFLGLVCFCVFGFGSVRRFLRCFCFLTAVTFLFAGAVVGVWTVFSPQGLISRNGAVYFDVSFLSLVLSCAALYAAVWLFSRFLFRRHSESARADVILTFDGRSVKCKGIVDTGNTLTDSFTGKKVSVIDRELALELFECKYAAAAINPADSVLPHGMHFIVSNTVGGTVLMCATAIDRLEIITDEKTVTVSPATIAVSNQTSFGNGCSVLLNADIVTGGREYGKNTVRKNLKAARKAEGERNTLHKRPRDPACTDDCSAGTGGDGSH